MSGKPKNFEAQITKMIEDLSLSTTQQFKDLEGSVGMLKMSVRANILGVETKIDRNAQYSEKRFDEVDRRFNSVQISLQALQDNDEIIFEELKDIKQNVKQIRQSVGRHDAEMNKFNGRLEKVEKKVGIVHK